MNYKSLLLVLAAGVVLILFMLAFVSNMYKDMLTITLKSENVQITITNDMMNVKTTLNYHNPERKNVPKHFKFPIAYFENLSTPEIINLWMPNIIESATVTEEGRFIEWSGSLGIQEYADVRIEYRQQMAINQIVYQLVSEDFIRSEIEYLSIRVVLPNTADNIQCSYPDIRIKESSGKKIVSFEGKVFSPDKDFILEWN